MRMKSDSSVINSPGYISATNTERYLAERAAHERIRNDVSLYYAVDIIAYWLAWSALLAPICFVSWPTGLACALLGGCLLFPFPFLWPLDVRVLYGRFRYNFYVFQELNSSTKANESGK